ncbi:MAG: AfsR/SARP family transcriptional regulator [Micromonosporaceae bacterium]|nr:AfsR/SARP family transcriptional regulator [Micromonosporaceae bacterium]
MRFGILGPTQVQRDDGQAVVLGGPRLRALLARLLVDPGRVVGTERLIDDLYGSQPPDGAGNALQSQVSRLRRALPEPSLVELHPAGYRLAVDPDQVDAHRFERLAADGHRALLAGDHRRAAIALRDAGGLWRGPALADVTGAPFAPGQVARLEELRLAATEDRIEADLALGESTSLVPELQQLVAMHPIRERVQGQLIRALYRSGRPAEALAVFEAVRQTLAEELGTDPSAELTELHRAVLRGDGPPAPAVPRAAVPAALPEQLSSFVGREEELRRVGKLLGEVRLVTVTGPGGAGKTRLAIEAAASQPGEVCFIELAALTDPAELPSAVLSALGLRETGLRDAARPPAVEERPDPTDRLVAALADWPLLLLIDNCEHLVAAAAQLVDRLLAAGPRLRVLATSREPLGLTGEALAPLSGLPLPPPDAAPEHTRLSPAVRLFLDRAGGAAPETTVDGLAAVGQICRTLDGLPLAIELAAARLRSLPVTELAARLDDRFRLLSRGCRTAQPRHQTLRAVVEWSWELLSEPERALARRLTWFAGGATLAAVEQVCQPVPDPPDPLDLLAGLVDKSLVEVHGGRYRMLETIRAYAAERLVEAGEADRLRRAHAAYFLDLAETADPYLRTADQLTWLSRLDDERENLHAALRRAVAAGDHDTGLRLVAALAMYWWLRGLRGEAATLAGELIAALGRQPPPGLPEEYALCVLVAGLGGPGGPAAPAAVWSSGALLTRPEGLPRHPFLLFLSAVASGPPEPGTDGIDLLLAKAEQLAGADPWLRALSPIGTGLARMLTGQLAAAERDLTAALAGFRALGERWGMMLALSGLADVAGWRGEPAAAIAPMDEALRLAGELGSTVDMADLLRARGSGRVQAGDAAGARADFQQAGELARRAGAPEVRAAAQLGLGELARRAGDLPEARRCYDAALATCPTGWYSADMVRAEICAGLGRVAEADGSLEPAADWYRRAVRAAVPAPAVAVEGLAGLALRAGDGERAGRLLGAGAALHAAGLAAPVAETGVPAEVRARIGEPAYRRAFTGGAALTREAALDLLT